MRINNNLMAMNTHRQLGINANNGAKSIEKLSSGYRINRAGDDAAGLAISEKMRGQIRGLTQASRNAQDGISMIQTAEGALNETQAILQRMRELSVQSANDTNQSIDRSAIQSEVNQLASEIDRIADTTQFNGKTLLKGDFASGTADINLQIGANGSQDIQVNIGDMRASSGATGLNIASAATGAAAVTEVAQVVGTGDEFVLAGVNVTGYTQADNLDIKIKVTTAGVASTSAAVADITVNGVTKSVTSSNVGATADSAPVFTLDGTNFDIFGTGQSVVITGANTPAVNDEANIKIAGQTSTVTGPDLSTFANAETAIGVIDSAINKVSSERASLGAIQNRLEHTIKNLDNGAENLQAAESRIRDVDMAKEMMSFTKNNILQQAAQAMLAQANQQPQGVLQLLR